MKTITMNRRYLRPAKGQARPPEARVAEFTNSGSLKMSFTTHVKVPDGSKEIIDEVNVENRRRLD